MIESLRHGYLGGVLRKRAELVQFAAVAIGLAFGVDLLAKTLASPSIPAQAIAGGWSVLIVLVVLGWWTSRSVSFSRAIETRIFVDVDREVVCGAANYPFSRDVADLLEAVIASNEDLEKQWYRESSLLINDNAAAKIPWLLDDCRKMIRDAIELVIFGYLSSSLSQTLKHYSDQRFVQIVPSSIHGRNHEMRLTLPIRTLLTRPGPNVLRLHSPRFRLEVKTEYRGETATLPRELLSGVFAESHNVKAQIVRVLVRCEVPFAALLLNRQSEYYGWIDVFLSSLDRAEYKSLF